MRDNRDPQAMGEALMQLRKMHPDKPMHEVADIFESMYKSFGTPVPQITYNANANGNGFHANSHTDT